MSNFEKISSFITKKAYSNIMGIKNDVEFLFDPFNSFVQVGLGGEWWNGKIDTGKNVLHHKKEHLDEAYKPVILNVKVSGQDMVFDISGGFLDKNVDFKLTIK